MQFSRPAFDMFHPRCRPLKGTVHQMYECVLDVLLYLERMSGMVLAKCIPASFEECPSCVILGVPLWTVPLRGRHLG